MNKIPIKKITILRLFKKIKKINLGNEKLSLDKSLGRFLSKDLKSKINLPPFKNSAVDGYAILKSNILQKKIKLICRQRIVAGDKHSKNVRDGEAIRIFTGARMPKNSSTVVMQENVISNNDNINIKKLPFYGENCRLLGEDIKKGRKILFHGDKIDSTNINLIAAIGKKEILVKKKIKIGFFTSGNELKEPTEKLKDSEINNSNYFSLSALLDRPYINRKYLGTLKDKEEIIKKSFLANTNKYDLIITTGGASVGEEDYIIKVINKLGKLFFWKAAIKPGRPIAFGKIKNTLIICLPGNPVSVHLLFGMIIRPFIDYLCGGKLFTPKGILAKIDFNMNKKNKRLEWLRVNINHKKKNLVVSKYTKQGSGMISSMVFADGIIEIPENVSRINKGEYYPYHSFKNLFY